MAPAFVEQINELVEGGWVELKRSNANALRCKLTTIIQPGDRYVFVNRRGMKIAEYTRMELAKQLDVHPNYLSQVINEKEQKNFYNYINALRIKEFIRLAERPESKNYTLLSLAYDCGFNSKSTFNKHFKLNTQKTPTQYFKSQNTD